jgi:hypothetical protein
LVVFERQVPIIIRILEALLRRLPLGHPKRPLIEQDLGSFIAGYKGEKSLDYYLDFLSDHDYLILHGIRLPFKNHFFQIDTLLLSKHYFLIIETKNNSGTLIYKHQFNQLLRLKDGQEEVLKNPLQQVKLQQYQFIDFLKKNKFPSIPIEHLVVMTHPKVNINTTEDNCDFVKRVVTSPIFLEKVKEFNRKHSKVWVSEKDVKKVSKQIIKAHTPLIPDVFKKYDLDRSTLQTGVQCSSCNGFAMTKHGRNWICPTCNFSSKDAHVDALKDYSLLFHLSISNQEAKDFLHLSSRTASYKLLKSLNFPTTGLNQSRKYTLLFD